MMMTNNASNILSVQQPTNYAIDKVLDDAQYSGFICLRQRNMKVFAIPPDRYELRDTTEIDLSYNRLETLPESVCEWCFLERLTIQHNLVGHVTTQINGLRHLKFLDLRYNRLSNFPVSICELQQLEILLLGHNCLEAVPREIKKLGSTLTELELRNNRLSSLPLEIGQLCKLRVLNVRNNLLIELPYELCKLRLEYLDARCNKISTIYPDIRRMGSLINFTIDSNPLVSPPAKICKRGWVHMFRHLTMEARKNNGLRLRRDDSLPDDEFESRFCKLGSKNFDAMKYGTDLRKQRQAVADSGYFTNGEENTNSVHFAAKTTTSSSNSQSTSAPPSSRTGAGSGETKLNRFLDDGVSLVDEMQLIIDSHNFDSSNSNTTTPSSVETITTSPTARERDELGEISVVLNRQRLLNETKRKNASQLRKQFLSSGASVSLDSGVMVTTIEQYDNVILTDDNSSILSEKLHSVQLANNAALFQRPKTLQDCLSGGIATSTATTTGRNWSDTSTVMESKSFVPATSPIFEESSGGSVVSGYVSPFARLNNNNVPFCSPSSSKGSPRSNSLQQSTPEKGHYDNINGNVVSPTKTPSATSDVIQSLYTGGLSRIVNGVVKKVGVPPPLAPPNPHIMHQQQTSTTCDSHERSSATNVQTDLNENRLNTVVNYDASKAPLDQVVVVTVTERQNQLANTNISVIKETSPGRGSPSRPSSKPPLPPSTQSEQPSVVVTSSTNGGVDVNQNVELPSPVRDKHGVKSAVPEVDTNEVDLDELEESETIVTGTVETLSTAVATEKCQSAASGSVKSTKPTKSRAKRNSPSPNATRLSSARVRHPPMAASQPVADKPRTTTTTTTTTTTSTTRSSVSANRRPVVNGSSKPHENGVPTTGAGAGKSSHSPKLTSVKTKVSPSNSIGSGTSGSSGPTRRRSVANSNAVGGGSSTAAAMSTKREEAFLRVKQAILNHLGPDRLPEDWLSLDEHAMTSLLASGELLCHLANDVKPRSVVNVNVTPTDGSKLSDAKARRNIENFLLACRKIGIPQSSMCQTNDVMDGKRFQLILTTISVLLKHHAGSVVVSTTTTHKSNSVTATNSSGPRRAAAVAAGSAGVSSVKKTTSPRRVSDV